MHERRASTLIELLVTIALVAVLAGLLLSAVQKVRAAASRLSCQNRMRQIGLGAIQHHDAAGGLPGVNSFFPPVDFALLGWLPRLLPYVEQGNAWAEVTRRPGVLEVMTGVQVLLTSTHNRKIYSSYAALVTHPWVGFWAVDEEHAVPA